MELLIDGTCQAPPRRSQRRWFSGAAVLVAGLGLGLGSVVLVNALFAATATRDADAFATGSVDLVTSPASTVVSSANMAPGDVVTAPLTVTNSGTLNLRYAVRSTVDDSADSIALAAELKLRIRSGVTTCTTAGFDVTGTDVYSSAAAGGGVFGSVAGTNLIGSATPGQDSGDRTLTSVDTAPDNAEILCVRVMLPTTASDDLQGLSTTATLTFDAEQTRNNGGS